MNTEVIGQNAGLVWEALNLGETLGTKQIKKITKLKDKDLYAALGWLARENKVNFEETEDGKELLVSLIQG